METLWFCLVAIMMTGYVVFDGFDLGTGIVHLLIARDDEERRTLIGTIGPVWDGNEVWLLAAGGTLYFAFPALYASSFSGFYLPLMMVLWLLIVRGIAIEFRNHLEHGLWRPFWDAGFAGASALLAIFFGAALGNVVRGVPLDSDGYFFLPLWTNFRVGPHPGILDWYTILTGVAALAALTLHGTLWVTLKTDGGLAERAKRVARLAWWAVALLTAAITAASFLVQPHLAERFHEAPWGFVFPIMALAGLMGIKMSEGREMEMLAFLSSAGYIVGMLTSAAFGLYPYVLPAIGDRGLGLTIQNTAAADSGLRVGLEWWIPGMALVGLYFAFVYRHFGGKVRADEHVY